MLLHTYRATVARWIDGDTVDLDVDVGFRSILRVRAQLARIDAPERGQDGAAAAMTECHRLAPPGSPVVVATAKSPRYGYWLAEITNADDENISDTLLRKGLARVIATNG